MTPIKIFFLVPTDRERRWLRRFSFSTTRACSKKPYGCDAMFEIGEADILYTKEGYIDATGRNMPPKADQRWPKTCSACGRPFDDKDEYQLFTKQIYIRESDGFRCTLADAPPGGCWDAWWISDRRKDVPTGCGYMIGPDHRSLIVKCPDGHEWMIDGRASNCTLPNDNTHHCWVRHGRPEDGTLHVDKNGNTCAAGAGSIQTPRWHGFLHNGFLTV
jgi:hypothetical protein